MADNDTLAITPKGSSYSILVLVQNATTGHGGAFLSTYKGAMAEIADPDNAFVPTNTDSGGIAVYKSTDTVNFTVQNYSNGSKQIGVAMYALEAE